MRKLTTVILAAGRGTRMNSPLPKVVHPVAGIPMIIRVIDSAKKAGSDEVRVVTGYGEELVRQIVEPFGGICFRQEEQLGTADAVRSAQVENLEGDVLILVGDDPLITSEDVKAFVKEFREENADLAVVTCDLKSPSHYGRIVRHKGQLHSIVEAKDASHDTLKLREVNTGIYVAKAKVLNDSLKRISNQNAQGEFYLTDIISEGIGLNHKVIAIKSKPRSPLGINSQIDLVKATKQIFRRKCKSLLDEGVIIIDPLHVYIEDSVTVAPASIVYPGVYLRGQTSIGSLSVIEPNCYISHSAIGDSCQIRAGSYLEEARVESHVVVGPYARLRPKTIVREKAQVGNFVEMKAVDFGKGSKANHLTYLGNAVIGEGVNIGCGTITCNYAVDRKKYETKIGNHVFVGSDSQFVAPVQIGDHAIIASGSTITKDVPENALGVARGKQINIEGYLKKMNKETK